MFQTTPEKLQDLLNHAHEGKIQLPDFQRSYVWNDDEIQNLIASVAKGYPIGAFLSLKTGGEVRFKPRLLEGVDSNGAKHSEPQVLLLDGQQRLTSLYQTFYSKNPVRTLNTRGKEIDRYYYLDIQKAIRAGADIKDAIIGVPEDRVLRKNFGRDVNIDLSTCDREFENHAFPLDGVFQNLAWWKWINAWQSYWKDRGEDVSSWGAAVVEGVIGQITGYQIPVIQLDQSNSREAICLIFEKVNTGGQRLNTFELLTATYAADEFDLREDWSGPLDKSRQGRRERILGSPRIDVLGGVYSTDFLQACALIHTREERLAKEREGVEGKDLPQVSCSRESLLSLPLDAYKRYADDVEHGFAEAASFLHQQKIIARKDVPYGSLLVGLAAAFAILRREDRILSAKDRNKVARWFWSATLGEVYGASPETLLARDVPELVSWIRSDGPIPRTLNVAIFQQDRLRSLRGRQSGAYKAIHALLMAYGCKDFVTGKPTELMSFFHDRIDIHHIFPKSWCEKNGISRDLYDYDSIVNKTPISAETNRSIGSAAPSVYLKRIEERYSISPEELDDILVTHCIEPKHLRQDDFYAFFNARIEALSDIISRAMDKPVFKEHGSNEKERDVDDPDEPEDDTEEEVDLIDLIRGGESEFVEFKETLRTNTHTGQHDKRMKNEVLKTLAGFLNSNGGRLFVGVSDEGTPVGLEADGFRNEDKMSLHLYNIINDSMGKDAGTAVHVNFDEFNGKRVMVVRCDRSSFRVFVKDGNTDRFYVRTGPSTEEMSVEEAVDYINRRFNQ